MSATLRTALKSVRGLLGQALVTIDVALASDIEPTDMDVVKAALKKAGARGMTVFDIAELRSNPKRQRPGDGRLYGMDLVAKGYALVTGDAEEDEDVYFWRER